MSEIYQRKSRNRKPWQFFEGDPRLGSFVLVDSQKNGKPTPWAEHKKFSVLVADSYRRLSDQDPALFKKAQAICDCGTWLKFSECPDGHKEGTSLIGASFCRQRLCPMCQWRRALLVAGQVSQVAQEAVHRHKVSFLLLTLTIKNCDGDHLHETINQVNGSLRKLLGYKRVKDQVVGWFRGLEVTVPRDNEYHPHLHVLLAVKPSYFSRGYLKTVEWVEFWRKALKVDYDPVCDIQAVKPGKGGLGGAAAESAKYSVKPGDLVDPQDRQGTDQRVGAIHYALHGRRSYAYGGILKEIHRELFKEDPEDPGADLVNAPEFCECPKCGGQLAQRIFHWYSERGKYISNDGQKRQEFKSSIDRAVDAWRSGKGRARHD